MSSLLKTDQSTLKFFTMHQELIKASQGDNVIVYRVFSFGFWHFFGICFLDFEIFLEFAF